MAGEFDIWDEILQGVSEDIPTQEALNAWTSDAVAIAASEIGNLGGSAYGADANSMDFGNEPSSTPGSEVAGAGPAAQTGGAESTIGKMAQNLVGPEEDPADVTRSAADVARGATGNIPGPGVQPESKGLLGGALQWAKDNPTAAAVIGTTAAGALAGAGKAANEKEIALRNIQAKKDLLTQQTNEQQRMSREGAYTGGTGVRPTGNMTLYRADGSPVYLPNGLIRAAMR